MALSLIFGLACTGQTPTRELGDSPTGPPEGRIDEIEIRMTDGGSGFPARCSPESAASLAHSFLEARAAGESELLASLLAPEDEFRWFSEVTDEGNVAAYDRTSALRHLLSVPRVSTLLMIRAKFDEVRRIANIVFVVTDLELQPGTKRLPRRTSLGKGAIECEGPSILVWTVGEAERDRRWPCEAPGDWRPGLQVVACGRA